MEVPDSVCDSSVNDILQERQTADDSSDGQDHVPCSQPTEMISSISSSLNSYETSDTNSSVISSSLSFISNACTRNDVDVTTAENQENRQVTKSPNDYISKLDNFKDSNELQDENSNLIVSNQVAPSSKDIDKKEEDMNNEEQILIIDTSSASCSSHSLIHSSFSHVTEDHFSRRATEDLNISLHDQKDVENIENVNPTQQPENDIHDSQRWNICKSDYSEMSDLNNEPMADINYDNDDNKNDDEHLVDQNISQLPDDSIIHSNSSENTSKEIFSLNAPHSPLIQEEDENNCDTCKLDLKKPDVSDNSEDVGRVQLDEGILLKEPGMMPEKKISKKTTKCENAGTYTEMTRDVKSCDVQSSSIMSTAIYHKELPLVLPTSMCSSSPSSSSLPSSSLSITYDSIPSVSQHGFYNSLKFSESGEKSFSDNQPSRQPFPCSDDQWMGMANPGINHNEATSIEARNSLETIKRKQKSLNDIIIRMLNDSSNKVQCSTESYVTNSSSSHLPLFLKGNSPPPQDGGTTQNLTTDVTRQYSNKNNLNEDLNDDDDDDDDENNNLEIQIDDDVEIEVTDKNDGKADDNGHLKSSCMNISNGGPMKYKDVKLHHVPNFSVENDFQKQSSSFIHEADIRNYQDAPDYQTVKADKEHSRADMLEPGYLFPYDSRLYNVHLFEKFLPHAYHDYKASSHFHESGHPGSRVLCNPGLKDHYSHNQDEFGSDAIDLTKNTRPNTTNSCFDNYLGMKNHEAYDERGYVNGCEEFDKKQVQEHKTATNEVTSFMEMNNNKIVCDNNLISSNFVVVSKDSESKGYDEGTRQDVISLSKMEEDVTSKEGLKSIKNYPEDLYNLKEPISKSLNFSSYSGNIVDMYHSNRDAYPCLGYDYQNACSKSSAKYSLMSDMGNSFYAYYNNAHYNGAMSLYGGIGHCLAMSDKMQQSDNKHVSSLEAEVLNLAKQDKGSKPLLDVQLGSCFKGDVNDVTDKASDSSGCNEGEQNVQTSNCFPLHEHQSVNSLEHSAVDEKIQTSYDRGRENVTSGNVKHGNAVSDQMQINNNSSTNDSDQSAIDSKQFPCNQSSLSTEHHREMAKTKSMWRDKYLAEDSSLHFTNFSSISRLEQCVSSINYDKPPAEKKERLKLSADVEKELQTFRMGLKMLGESGMKLVDDKDDFICDQSLNNTPGKNKKSGSNQKLHDGVNTAEYNIKSNKKKSKSNKETKSKKAHSSDVFQDFNVNNFHVNGSSIPQCPENYSNDLARHTSRNEQLACNIGMNSSNQYDINSSSSMENGKKRRGRKKKDTNPINHNAENHFKMSESPNFSEHVHNFNMVNTNYQGYQDYYNNNLQQHFRKQQHQQMPVGYPHVPQSDKTSILKVPESHVFAVTPPPTKKKQIGDDCKKSKNKEKNKNSANHIRQTEKAPTTNNDNFDDAESFLCNGASLDIYLNEPKACQQSVTESVMEQKHEEETNLPFTFDVEQKTFTCHICNYQVKRKGQLMKHLGGHQVFVCTHCSANCPDQKKLEEHLLEKHPTRCGRRLCKRCHVLFRLEELEQHEVDCNGEKQGWSCDLCDKKFRFLSAVKNHVIKWHKNEPSRFESKIDDFVKKQKSKSNAEGNKNNKGIEYVDESTILDEIQIIDLPQLETSSIDVNSFTEASSPNRDSSTDAGSGSSLALFKEGQALDCQGDEISKSSIGIVDNKKSRTFQCKACPKFYRSMQSLKIHKQKKHGEHDEKQLELGSRRVASRQGKTGASSSEETCHLETRNCHSNDAEQIEELDKSDSVIDSKEILSVKKCHEQDLMNYGSPSTNFKDASSNDNTDEDASSEIPSSHLPLSDGWFQCTYESCSKKFRKLEQVQKHEERHPIDKIYKCDWPGCRKAYIHYANLYSHRSHHITAKPFVCNLCSSAYWQKCSLNSHKARVHGIKNPAHMPGIKSDKQKVDRPTFDTCDDDSKTITSNVSDSEANLFYDKGKSESGTISFTGLIQLNYNNEGEQLSDLNDKIADDKNDASSKDESIKKSKSTVKEVVNKKTKSNKSYPEKSKSKMSTNLIDSNGSEENSKCVNQIILVSKEKTMSKSTDIQSSKGEIDKSEASQASTCNRDLENSKKKRGRKPKSSKVADEMKAVEEKVTPTTKKEEKPENSLDFFKADGYKPSESRCVVEELLLTARIPLSQHNPEDMTPLEVALNDLGAREIESCDDAYTGTEKTKTKRKIRTSLNYRKKSKLAKGNQEVTVQLEQTLLTTSNVMPALANDLGRKSGEDNMKLSSEMELQGLPCCNVENKIESTSERIIFKEVEAVRFSDQNMDLYDKMSDVVKSGLEFDSLSSEMMADTCITKRDKFTIGNVYEFCESEGDECIGSNKSSVKKKFINKKQTAKKSELPSESRNMDDSDDNTSINFKLSRDGCKPPMTYLNRTKKKPLTSMNSSSPVSMISEESIQELKMKQKRKLKSESSDSTLYKKHKVYSSNDHIDSSFGIKERDSSAFEKDEIPCLAINNERPSDDRGERFVSQPTPTKRISKRRKNEVEVLLEDTLSRPATADKKSNGRPSKRSELFNFDRSMVQKPEVKLSVDPKKVDIRGVEQKTLSKDTEEYRTIDGVVKSTNAMAALSEVEGNKTIQNLIIDSNIESSEYVVETQSQPIESRLAKKRKAESLVPMFYEDNLQMKDEKSFKKNVSLENGTEGENAENSSEICSESVGVVKENEIKDSNNENVVPTSSVQTYENNMGTEIDSITENPLVSSPNIILKLQIRDVDKYPPSMQSTQDNEGKSDSHTSEQLNDYTKYSTADVSTAAPKQDLSKVPNKDMIEDTDSQLSLIDSLEYLRIAEIDRAAVMSENVPVASHLADNIESVVIGCRQAATSPVVNNIDKQADHSYKEDEYCIEDGDDNGGFVKPSEPPSTWRNYDYEDTCYEHQSERKKFKGKLSEDHEVDSNKRNPPNNEEPDKLCHFHKNDSNGKDGFCQNAIIDEETKRKKSEMPDEGIGNLSKNDVVPDSASLRAGLADVEDEMYHSKSQIFDHTDVAYSDEQFRDGVAPSRPISPFNHSKELTHPGSNRKDSKLSVDALAEGQPYHIACSSSYFDYQTMAVKRSDPHPLSSLESLATLAPSSGLGGYFDSVVPPEKRLSNDLNKPPRSNNFHPEAPPPPPHAPFPTNPYRNFPSYEADLALLSANRHKSYRYNERPFDPSLAYSYDRPDLHHPSYHMGSNFASPDSRFFSQFLQSADAVDQRYYMGQQGGFSDFQKGTGPLVPGDPKHKFTSTSFTSLLTGSPYSGLSDSYLSSLTPNISNPSLATNQLGNYGRSEGWASERPWTAAPPFTNDPSIQYQQHQQPPQQQHGSSRKQQPPTNDYDAHAPKKTPSSSSSASVRGSGDSHFYNSYEGSSPRLRNLATPGPPPPVSQSGHKRLEEAYRHAAAIMSSDYNQHHHPSLIQPTPSPATDVYGPVDPMMGPAAFPSFNRYYYSAARDAVYRSQQRLAAMHHHQQQQTHNSSLSPFSNVNLAGFATPGYPPDPFTSLPASTSGMPYSSKNHHYPSGRGGHGNSGGGKHHQIQPSSGAPPPQTNSKSKSSKAALPPLGLGGMAPSFDHLNSSNFLHQQNPPMPPDPYRQSVIYNMIPKYF